MEGAWILLLRLGPWVLDGEGLMTERVSCWVAGLSAVILSIAGPANAQQEPMSVCEVQTKLRSIRGTQVVIKGNIRTGRHGTYLSRGDSFESCPEIERSGLAWPPVIAVRFSDRLEPGRLAKLNGIWGLIKTLPDSDYGTAVVVQGKLRTKRNLEIRKLDFDGETVHAGNGFGQFGMCPALIVVTDIDIVISNR